uniref:Uncharacterized protein n=1 Tax=Tanacetum cinerariifolium TaxID=118510 RepID=A0A6L2P4C8_TANCI|nr:hypothetical protein [Tanacetum cinerariifolium]
MIDVFNKKITLRVGDDDAIFDVDQSIKRPPAEDDECYGIDVLDDTINIEAQDLLRNDDFVTLPEAAFKAARPVVKPYYLPLREEKPQSNPHMHVSHQSNTKTLTGLNVDLSFDGDVMKGAKAFIEKATSNYVVDDKSAPADDDDGLSGLKKRSTLLDGPYPKD